jgi:hypothetical protein
MMAWPVQPQIAIGPRRSRSAAESAAIAPCPAGGPKVKFTGLV